MASRMIGKIFLFALIVGCSAPTLLAQDRDIGLRLRDDGKDVPIAVRPEADLTSPLRIHKDGNNYCIGLVDVGDPLATNMLINLPTGEIKAFKRYVSEPQTVTFHAAHAPLYNPPIVGDPNYDCKTRGKCPGWMKSNGLYPVQISDKTKFSPGNKLRITSVTGNVGGDPAICGRVHSYIPGGWGNCKNCCCRNDPDYCGDVTGRPDNRVYQNNPRIKIGFYRTNTMSPANLPIAEYPLSDFIGNDVIIPEETEYIFVYYIDVGGESAYADNNIAYKMILSYEIR